MKEVRPGDQQHPVKNGNEYIQFLVIEDLKERLQEGMQRYGVGLQGHNGRDMLQDAYDEAMDLCVYLRGAIWERENPVFRIPIADVDPSFMAEMRKRFPLVDINPPVDSDSECCGEGCCGE